MNTNLFNNVKICTSLIASNKTEMINSIEKAISFGTKFIEIRFDYINTSEIYELLPLLKKYSDQCIYTCRKLDQGGSFKGNEKLRIKILEELSKHNPSFIDIELITIKNKPELAKTLRSNGSSLIVSWHNFSETPNEKVLKSILTDSKKFGDISKIVTFAQTFQDNNKIFSLYKSETKGKLIAFCMGELGIISRILCVTLGSPLTYASIDDNQTAKGQISILEMKKIYAAF